MQVGRDAALLRRARRIGLSGDKQGAGQALAASSGASRMHSQEWPAVVFSVVRKAVVIVS
jgi:hypothetical protein